jgi:cysteinyl-tRNA synthetase
MTQPASRWFYCEINDELILQHIEQRRQAKLQKNWLLADQIRQNLSKDGVILEDKLDGSTSWRKV